jgi:hypothetical protein
MDIVTYGVLSKRINGILSGVKSTEIQGTSLIFNFTDGTSQTMTFPIPADGKDGANGISIVGLEITPTNHLIGTFSDGSVVDAGLITTIRGERGYTGTAGKDGKDGIDGANGVDGISPTVTITEATGRHTVSITDKDGVKSFVVKDGSALDVDNYYTKDEVITELATKANIADIPVVPVNVSEFTNDAGYIKNTVDNLIHYYNKADVYTQTEVNMLISNINKLTSQIVDQLPTEDIDTSVIYLIKQEDANAYMQYMYINSAWAELGTTQVDLSDYYKKSEVDTKLAEKANKTELPTVPSVVSAFTNDAGYLTEYTETDPTVPAWAKSPQKPQYSCEEIGALPEDTEIPIFTNKAVLDKISEEKVESWDEAVTSAHTHDNKIVLDKFTESDEGEVLYKGKQIASGNLWNGTKEEFDAIENKDPDTTYVITDDKDDEVSLSDLVIDDSSTTSEKKSWSVKKINDTVVLKNTGILYKNAPTSSGMTTFTLDISSLGLTHGIYHFKCYIVGNGNVAHCAEGSIGQYDGSYYISIDYKSSHISSIIINGTTITVTTSAAHYNLSFSIQSIYDWAES